MAATELKSVEFVFYSKGIIEIFDVHTYFTAGRMLYLFRSITRGALAAVKPLRHSEWALAGRGRRAGVGRHSGRRTGRGGPCGVRERLFGRPGSLPAGVRAGLAAVWAVCGLVAARDIVLVYGPTHHSRPMGPRGVSSFANKGLCHRSESQTM